MDSVLLTWILATAVLLSLGFSAAALIILIKRNKRQKNASAEIGNNRKYNEPYVAPPQNYYPQQPLPGPLPPVTPDYYDDQNEKTQSLFSSRRNPMQEANTPSGLLVSCKSYTIYISETGPSGARTYQLNIDGTLTVGRAKTSGLYIDDSTVSGLQCLLTASPDGLLIENKSGSNITKLNGVALTGQYPLRINDTIKIGKVQLLILNLHEIY